MRPIHCLALLLSITILGFVGAKPLPPKGKDEPAPTFKPLDLAGALNENDPKDEKLNHPSRKFPIKLAKDKTYVIDMVSKDFDTYLRVLDKTGKQLAEDDDGGGDLNSRIILSPTENGDHTIVATTFDGQVGKFTLKVRELNLKGEAKARPVGKDGITLEGEIGQNDATDLDKLSKVLTVQIKGGGPSHIFEVKSEDFDPQVYVFNAKGKLLGQDPEKVVSATPGDGIYHIVVKSFDSQLGKFEVKVRSFAIKGEAEPRELGKDGLKITAQIGEKDMTPIGKFGKIYSVQLKAGQTYEIYQEAQNLSSYLYLFDRASALLAQDDGTADPNSKLMFRAEHDGIYHILATTVLGLETGEFTLTVRKKL